MNNAYRLNGIKQLIAIVLLLAALAGGFYGFSLGSFEEEDDDDDLVFSIPQVVPEQDLLNLRQISTS